MSSASRSAGARLEPRRPAVCAFENALAALLTPPGQIEAVTGWVLSADGKWLVKLFGFALASQAWVAWALRRRPNLAVARALALYQLGSATADWAMWILLADEGVFSTSLGQVLVTISIATHYALGLLLVRAIRRATAAQSEGDAPRGTLLPVAPNPRP